MFRPILFLFGLLPMFAHAQYESWAEARVKTGFLVAHRSIMGHMANEHAFAGEFSYYFRGNGEKWWHEPYHRPRYGVSLFVGSTGNRDLMGLYFGGYGFTSIPLIRTKHYEFSGRLGTGLGYARKVYDAESNMLSIGTSTHVNILVSLALENRWEFGNNSVNLILDMTHFSNGAIKVPNLGLNLPYLSLGYGRRIRQAPLETPIPTRMFKKSWEYGVIGLASMKEVYPTGGPKYSVFGLNAVGRRYFKPAVGMEVSLDGMYSESLRTYESDVPIKNSELMQLGLFTGYILPFDRFHLLVGMGVYLRDKFHFQEPVYHRVGMRYRFDNGLNINLVLKSHWARADYVEYGIGYTFKK